MDSNLIKKCFSIVVTIYNNEMNIPITIPHYLNASKEFEKKYTVEFIFVNDGSTDNSYHLLEKFQKKYPNKIKIINLTRNFGQENASMAGICYAKGEVVGYITSDMQDPIELFAEMLTQWENGSQLVIASRAKREEKGVNIFFSKLIHYFVNKTIDKNFPKGGYDFFLMDRIVANKLIEINERNGNSAILLLWFGYKHTYVSYTRKEREVGKSSWTLFKKIKLIIDTFVTNSYLPLRIISIIGILSSGISFLYGAYLIVSWFTYDGSSGARGWTTIVVLIAFFSGLILLSLGTIGEYLWRIFDYAKQRPQYIIDEVIDDTKK